LTRTDSTRRRIGAQSERVIWALAGTDALVNEYLHRLALALATVPQLRRVQIMRDVAALVYETRSTAPADSPSAVVGILERVGRPEDLARRAVGDQRAVIESRRHRWLLTIGLVMVGVGILGCLGALLLSS